MADQNVGMDVYANFGDSRLKSSEAPFSALFRKSITSDRKHKVTSYLCDCRTDGLDGSRDIRLPHFVTNDDDAGVRRSSHKGKMPYGVLPKNQKPEIRIEARRISSWYLGQASNRIPVRRLT